jgi:hypothetical protein
MMFDYMDHDMTGLLERSQKEGKRFTAAQVRQRPCFDSCPVLLWSGGVGQFTLCGVKLVICGCCGASKARR